MTTQTERYKSSSCKNTRAAAKLLQNYSILNDHFPRYKAFVMTACSRIETPRALCKCQCTGNSCDQKPYLHNETKGGICIKIEFNPRKNISLLQHGRRFFVYSFNMAAVTSCEHNLLPVSLTSNFLSLLLFV